MNNSDRNEIKEALAALLKDHGITTLEQFDSIIETEDIETGMELFEDLKAGILEEYDVDLDLIDELTEEILG